MKYVDFSFELLIFRFYVSMGITKFLAEYTRFSRIDVILPKLYIFLNGPKNLIIFFIVLRHISDISYPPFHDFIFRSATAHQLSRRHLLINSNWKICNFNFNICIRNWCNWVFINISLFYSNKFTEKDLNLRLSC